MLGLPLIHWLVVFSVLISVAGASVYIRDTLAGRTQPNRVSWSMWALSPLISTAAALSAGAARWATLRIFIAGLLPLLIFLASFVNQRSYWKISIFDLTCGAFSLLAVILWGAIASPQLAILCAIIGDIFASFPTLIKTWKYPKTETGAMYIASFLSVVLVLPSIPVWNIANAAFQIHLLIMSSVLLYAVYRHRVWKRFGAVWSR
ncbi:hypothetical protein [Acaryochloris sp. IP29b_bin.137]|uniref:hypothetical protein n=1 Tax=Acaryochloris sp. IP29b_bin.137 TaxID=2969217 RepID=UPI002619689E|nr:hypothetical protein [Acaryochloris sp. IP29b_bin.137]